ncbi:hypothetical protein ACFQ61_08555 [Streptomyces sp. NPDC056500]|uniref:hypothetical protein n=1 Tax=Streptomyces sp. NPDC056500 TaxID=3345840 RepID=UPI00369437F9
MRHILSSTTTSTAADDGTMTPETHVTEEEFDIFTPTEAQIEAHRRNVMTTNEEMRTETQEETNALYTDQH